VSETLLGVQMEMEINVICIYIYIVSQTSVLERRRRIT